jgi:hypothetical protein
MQRAAAIMLGLVPSFPGMCAAAGDDPPLAYLQLDQRLGYSDLVCSATIMDTWRTSETLAVNSAVTRENLARADVDSVFKGKLTSALITFRWYSWPAGDSNTGPGGYAYGGPPLAGLRNGTRYLLFLRGDDAIGWQVTVPMYQLEIPLAPQPAANAQLLLDASGFADADRNRQLAEEFAAAARLVEPLGDAAGPRASRPLWSATRYWRIKSPQLRRSARAGARRSSPGKPPFGRRCSGEDRVRESLLPGHSNGPPRGNHRGLESLVGREPNSTRLR